jgi:hypothetical protein
MMVAGVIDAPVGGASGFISNRLHEGSVQLNDAKQQKHARANESAERHIGAQEATEHRLAAEQNQYPEPGKDPTPDNPSQGDFR